MVQETFLRSYKQIHSFDGRATFGTWLASICVNCSLNLIRARKNRKEQTPPAHATSQPPIGWIK